MPQSNAAQSEWNSNKGPPLRRRWESTSVSEKAECAGLFTTTNTASSYAYEARYSQREERRGRSVIYNGGASENTCTARYARPCDDGRVYSVHAHTAARASKLPSPRPPLLLLRIVPASSSPLLLRLPNGRKRKRGDAVVNW